MIWGLVFLIWMIIAVFCLLLVIIGFVEDKAPKYLVPISLVGFALIICFIKYVLFNEVSTSRFLTPRTYDINEKTGTAYFYTENTAIETREYLFIKNAKDVRIEEVTRVVGCSNMIIKPPLSYRLALTNDVEKVEK